MMDGVTTALWNVALRDLEGQMTRATFDTWLRSTECLTVEDETLVISVSNGYAVEWLENRLNIVIDRTLHRLTGNGVKVRYVVQEKRARAVDAVIRDDVAAMVARLLADPAARRLMARGLGVEEPEPISDAGWVAPAFDEGRRWFPVHEYVSRFWGAYLGAKAFRLWEAIRKCDVRKDKSDGWTPVRRFAAPELAREVGCSRQAIVGVDRECEPETPGGRRKHPVRIDGSEGPEGWYIHSAGALDRLTAAGVAEVAVRGRRQQRTYEVRVRTVLGWLSPTQVAGLPAEMQSEHQRWVEEAGADNHRWEKQTIGGGEQ